MWINYLLVVYIVIFIAILFIDSGLYCFMEYNMFIDSDIHLLVDVLLINLLVGKLILLLVCCFY